MKPGVPGLVVEVHAGAAGLRAVIADWEALAADALEPNPFYEHWMLLPALEAYGERDFRCVTIWDNGTLAALFPMRLQRPWRGLPVQALRSYRHRNMLLCTPLVRARGIAHSPAKYLAALLQQRLAPVVEFDWIPAGGRLFAELVDAVTDHALPWTVTDAYARALLLRERDPRAAFNSNMKNNLRRWQARLASAGQLSPVRLAPGDDLAAWTEGFMRLEASGWKGRAGSAMACRPEDQRFGAAVFAEAFRRRRLHITGLDLDGRPLARHIMISAGDGSVSYKIAYDEAHARSSPGILAEVDNVRQFMETPGPRWLDSNTARQSTGYARVWKDRRTVLRVAVGTRGAGYGALAALPAVRLAKKGLQAVGVLKRPN